MDITTSIAPGEALRAAVLDACLTHPEWGTPEGARRNWSLLQSCLDDADQGGGARSFAALADLPGGHSAVVLLDDAIGDGSHIYDEDWFGDGSCVVHGAVLVGDLVVDVTARRFDERLPFPLIVPLREWEQMGVRRVAAA